MSAEELDVEKQVHKEPESRKKSAPPREFAWDWIVSVVCISAGVVGLRLVNDSELWDQVLQGRSAAQAIGTALRNDGGVRYRPSGSLVWHDLSGSKQRVGSGDTLFTNSEGKVELKMDDGGYARIMPNSLVVIEGPPPEDVGEGESEKSWLQGIMKPLLGSSTPKPKAPAETSEKLKKKSETLAKLASKQSTFLNVQQGSVKLDLQPGAKPMAIIANDQVFEIGAQAKGTALEINADASGVKFSTEEKGKLEIKQLDSGSGVANKVQVSAGTTAVVSGEGKLKAEPILLSPVSPKSGSLLVHTAVDERIEVELKWKKEAQVPPGWSSTLEIHGPQQPLSVPLSVESSVYALKLGEGEYKWRIASAHADGTHAQTGWSSFNVSPVAIPKILGPVNGTTLWVEAGQKQGVGLSWRRLPIGVRAEVSVRSAAGDALVEPRSNREGAQLELNEGEYFWKVRAVSESNAQVNSLWSAENRFVIRVPQVAAAAAPGETAAAAPPTETSPLIAATPVATTPPVAVAPPAPAPAPVAKVEPPVKVAPPAPQPTVVAKAPPPPPPKPAIEVLPSLEAGEGGADTKLSADGKLNEVNVTLQWKAIPNVTAYKVALLNKAGAKVKEETVKEPKLKVVVQSLDETFHSYQVSALLPSGKMVESQATPIRIELSAPSLKRPLDDASYHAGGNLLMTWERTSLTQYYEVQIGADSGFRELVLSNKRPSNFLQFEMKDVGTYYWRVRSFSKGGQQSGWSPVGTFHVK